MESKPEPTRLVKCGTGAVDARRATVAGGDDDDCRRQGWSPAVSQGEGFTLGFLIIGVFPVTLPHCDRSLPIAGSFRDNSTESSWVV